MFLFKWHRPALSDCELGRHRSPTPSSAQGYLYNVLYIALIYFFCYFWTAITFNPKDMANNLKDYGSFIPGYRPGKRTADYLEQVHDAHHLRRRRVPRGRRHHPEHDLQRHWTSTTRVASFYGGTGLLIVISVALDLVQKINSHLVMRNYPRLDRRLRRLGELRACKPRRDACVRGLVSDDFAPLAV